MSAGTDNAAAVDLAVSQIEKQFGKGTIMRLGEDAVLPGIEVIPTGSLALDIALGVGGVGGRDDQLPVSEYLDSIADDSDSHLVVAWRGSGPFEACKLIEVNPASAIVARDE